MDPATATQLLGAAATQMPTNAPDALAAAAAAQEGMLTAITDMINKSRIVMAG